MQPAYLRTFFLRGAMNLVPEEALRFLSPAAVFDPPLAPPVFFAASFRMWSK